MLAEIKLGSVYNNQIKNDELDGSRQYWALVWNEVQNALFDTGLNPSYLV